MKFRLADYAGGVDYFILCGPRTARLFNEILKEHAIDWGYNDEEPMKTKKYKKAYRKMCLEIQKRSNPLPLP